MWRGPATLIAVTLLCLLAACVIHKRPNAAPLKSNPSGGPLSGGRREITALEATKHANWPGHPQPPPMPPILPSNTRQVADVPDEVLEQLNAVVVPPTTNTPLLHLTFNNTFGCPCKEGVPVILEVPLSALLLQASTNWPKGGGWYNTVDFTNGSAVVARSNFPDRTMFRSVVK